MDTSNADDLLQFQDYSNTTPAQINVNSPTNSSGGIGSGGSSRRQRGDPLTDLIYDMNNSAQMLNDGDAGLGGRGNIPIGSAGLDDDANTDAGNANASFLTIEYYQRFFNVDTYMVLERIVNSMIPKRASVDYLRKNITPNPDLYGPFWINVTLIFSIAISGNIASYLQHANENYHWRYNFHLVSYAATCIFIYANLVPLALWAIFKYSLKPLEEDLELANADYTPSMLSLMCIYGYSLAIYIPVSILWVIQVSFLQWLLVITAALLSGISLIIILQPALRNSKLSLFLMPGILGAHFLLAAGFMLYFFHVPGSTMSAHVEMVTKVAKILVTPSTERAFVGDLPTSAD